MIWPDKSQFEGDWLNDCRLRGHLEMPDENIYEGEFQNDQMHGVGKIIHTRE